MGKSVVDDGDGMGARGSFEGCWDGGGRGDESELVGLVVVRYYVCAREMMYHVDDDEVVSISSRAARPDLRVAIMLVR
jgi:hypothetical protein